MKTTTRNTALSALDLLERMALVTGHTLDVGDLAAMVRRALMQLDTPEVVLAMRHQGPWAVVAMMHQECAKCDALIPGVPEVGQVLYDMPPSVNISLIARDADGVARHGVEICRNETLYTADPDDWADDGTRMERR